MELKKVFFTNKDLETLGIRNSTQSRNLRWRGVDPIPSYKIGGQTKYALKDLKAYLKRCKIEGIKI